MDLDELLGQIPPDTWARKLRRQVYRHSPRELRRQVRWGVQRWRRGYSDCDVWSFDHHLARIIPPAMRQLNHELQGVPGTIMEQCDGDVEVALLEWRRILEAVAAGFEAWQTMSEEYPEGERLTELTQRWEHGAELLVKHFGAFWD